MKRDRKKTKTKRKEYLNSKELSLPDKFHAGFLQTLDKRSVVYQAVRRSFLQTVDDLGGEENLSHAHIVLVERFCFGEILLQNIETALINKPGGALVSRWLSVTKVLALLSARIGLDRKARPAERLESYIVASKKNKTSKKGKRK